MRVARRKMRGFGCYYHLYNRVTGMKSYLPFGNEEKEYAFNLITDLSRYFLLDIISVCWMGNHCHIVLYAPGEPPIWPPPPSATMPTTPNAATSLIRSAMLPY